MHETLRGVVLNVIKYNDRNNIVHIYTDRHGLLSFLVAQGKTAAARMRNAMMMPLSLVQFETNIVPGKDIFLMHDLQRTHRLNSIYADPVKNAVAMFISELLSHTIQEREQNRALFQYIETAVLLLDNMSHGAANFHILLGGTFVSSPGLGGKLLKPDDARVIMLLSRMTFSNLHKFRFNRDERNQMLDTIIAYYRLHNSTIGTLRSPDILKQLFV